MWKKITVFTYKIPLYNHNGFMIDIYTNSIVNLNNNFSIKIPFKLFSMEQLYYYEMVFNCNTLTLNYIINIARLGHLTSLNKSIPLKNSLFEMLYYYNNSIQKKTTVFHKLPSLSYISNQYNIIPYELETTVEFENIHFDLITEQIKHNSNMIPKILVQDIYFIFYKNYNLDILPKNKPICIVDDITKPEYKLKTNIINYNNYTTITKTFFTSNPIIILDKDLFLSKKYLFRYKKFHTKYTSKYCYNNYKASTKKHCFNIELFDNYTVFLCNISAVHLYNHPIQFSNQKKIFLYSSINSQIIKSFSKFLVSYYNYKYNEPIKIQTVLDKIFFIDSRLYEIYGLLQNSPQIRCNKLSSYNFPISIHSHSEFNNDHCYINYCQIGTNSHYTFSCNHTFIIDNIVSYVEQFPKCPVCSKSVTSVKANININTFIIDILGSEFMDTYDVDSTHYIISKLNHNIETAIHSYTLNIKCTMHINTITLSKPTKLYIDDSFDMYMILNNIPINNLKNIIGIYKISQHI